VNLSAVQFNKSAIVEAVRQALVVSVLPASRLDLTVKEVALSKDTSTTLAILHELRELGTTISMDDFGTGNSSLSLLRRFPFDRIKIHRSFVQGLPDSEEARETVRALAALGRSLSMRTLADGAETTDQFAHARLAGCDEAQGYSHSGPLAPREARHLAAREATELSNVEVG
jgi:EAL domain-containing protein (putative c-di-GMP-specific phosphodiesterase class I)